MWWWIAIEGLCVVVMFTCGIRYLLGVGRARERGRERVGGGEIQQKRDPIRCPSVSCSWVHTGSS